MANLTEKYIRINMETNKQTPSECRHYKNGACAVHNNTKCLNTLFSVRYGYQKPNCPDYEQKKRECFVQFCKDNGIDQEVNISIFDAFDQIFDRAFALGKQTETISQEEIKKLAEEFAEREYEIGQVDRDALHKGYYHGMKDALGKQEKAAEGEEMLTVPRKKVQEEYCESIKKAHPYNINSYNRGFHVGCATMLKTLFGSKCLPDEAKDEAKDGAKEPKPAEPKFMPGDIAVVHGFEHPLLKQDGAIVTILSYHDKGDFYSCAIAPNVGIDVGARYLSPYKAQKEPKYHVGEKVRYNGYVYEVIGLSGRNRYILKGLNFDLDEDMIEPYPEPLSQNPTENCDNESHISADCDKPAEPKFKVGDYARYKGDVHKVVATTKDNRCYLNKILGSIDESDLEPYTEPTDFGKEVNFPTKKQSRNFSQETANCDNRLQVAAMAMQGILSNIDLFKNVLETGTETLSGDGISYRAVAKASLLFADALIAESEKRTVHGK